MSREYKEETVKRYETQIERLLKTAPPYIRDFYEHIHNGKREITTQAAYIRDISAFLGYLKSAIPFFSETEICNLPEEIFEDLTVKDLNEYRAYLHDEIKISNSSIKKKFAAVSAFYKYMNSDGRIGNNPMRNFEQPAVNSHRIIKLNSEMSGRLLEGILNNRLYLEKTSDGEKLSPVPRSVFVRREPLVLRNYAICCLFLGSGLRVSELVGLDLSDINFNQNSLNIIAKGGNEVQVYFGDEVADALKNYIYGKKRPDKTSLRTGRDGFNPPKNEKAVFLSSRGTRMTVRMVEVMIKEAVKTYLPDYDDKELFSPHKLRATCATRILAQTGDIELASTQLNHKSIAVTAAFYAELQKEKQKEKIKNLDINDW